MLLPTSINQSDNSRMIRISLLSSSSACLQTFSPHYIKNSNDCNDDMGSFPVEILGLECTRESIILDLAAMIIKVKEDEFQGVVSLITYHYKRLDEYLIFELLPLGPDGVEELKALEYVFSQFVYFETSIDLVNNSSATSAASSSASAADEDNQDGEDNNSSPRPNLLALGFQGTGQALRVGLRVGGQATGSAIRFLGQKYTELHEKKKTDREVLPEEQERAMSFSVRAEGVHAGARQLTGAILFPIRYTGQLASEYATNNSSGNGGGGGGGGSGNGGGGGGGMQQQLKQGFFDTASGLGNGLANVFKGITEGLSEIGEAIGDTAISHSKQVYGEEYAEKITKAYVSAASEIGLGAYKVGNVAAFGLTGLLIDGIVEGSMLSLALYDFLVGPVLLAEYMDMIAMPATIPTRYFVVLRPWSLSFYEKMDHFAKKPFKIIPTSMLDTMPKIRTRSLVLPPPPIAAVHSASAAEEEVEMMPIVSSASTTAADFDASNTDAVEAAAAAAVPLPAPVTSTVSEIQQYFERMRGGNKTHVSICFIFILLKFVIFILKYFKTIPSLLTSRTLMS